MKDLVAVAVGLGLVLGVLGTELLGLAASGLVVPGYLALHLHEPKSLAATLAVAFATLGSVRFVSTFAIVHGRRRTAAMLLVGYLLGLLTGEWSGLWTATDEHATIGLVIPGLIALGMDKQGVVETLSALTVIAVLVRLVLLAGGAEVPS